MYESDHKENADPSPATGRAEGKDMRVAALRYNSDEEPAPIVVAAGSGYVAQKILEIADECGISVYHDDSAATLLSKLNLGQEIPPELYQMVVDIYLTVLAAAKNSKQTLGEKVQKAAVQARKKEISLDESNSVDK